jgi:hypothetical protein
MRLQLWTPGIGPEAYEVLAIAAVRIDERAQPCQDYVGRFHDEELAQVPAQEPGV